MTHVSPASTCYRHPGRETYIRCTRCDRPICPDCMAEASVGFQCPTCVAEGRASQRPARTWFGGTAAGQTGYVTITLIALNVAVFLISVVISKGQAIGGGLFGGSTSLHDWGALVGPDVALDGQPCPGNEQFMCDVTQVAPGVDSGAYYRLFTSMFLHYGPLHLLMNMWALWVLGRNLEFAFGPVRFAALYLLSGLGGGVAVYLFSPGGMTAGASGAIFGLFGALIIVLRKLGRSLGTVMPVLIANIVFTFAIPGISIAGHLGGLATGALVGAGLAYAPAKNRTRVQVGVLIGTAVVLLVLVLLGSVIAGP